MPLDFEDVMHNYFEFLDNVQNELFVHICYSQIEKFNENIMNYLNKTDFNGIKHIDNINNSELIELLKLKINDMSKNK